MLVMDDQHQLSVMLAIDHQHNDTHNDTRSWMTSINYQ
jgi:hypothetical protein